MGYGTLGTLGDIGDNGVTGTLGTIYRIKNPDNKTQGLQMPADGNPGGNSEIGFSYKIKFILIH